MKMLLQGFAISVLLFSWLVSCEDLELPVDGPPTASRYVAKQNDQNIFGSTPIDGRSLIDSWLGRRQFVCEDAGYSPCPNNLGCCPTGGTCCTAGCCKSNQSCCGINRCADPGDTCCTLGTCPSGWKCCTPGTCYPVGGQCCATGQYCTAGNICVLVRGLQKCCTDVHCTAHVSGGVTLTAAAGANEGTKTSIALTTKATTSVVTEEILVWYYFTITWYYYSYFWTFRTRATTTYQTSTYTEITTSTVFSIQDTDSYSASRSFRSISATFPKPTPAAATILSPLPSSTSSTTSTSSTESTTSTETTSSASSSSSAGDTGTRSTVGDSSVAVSDFGTGASTGTATAASASNSSSTSESRGTTLLDESWHLGYFLMIFVGLGGMMIWL